MSLFTKDFAEELREVMKASPGWLTIDELLASADEADVWPEGFAARALNIAKKHLLRRGIKQLRDGSGHPEIASVETLDDEGNPVRIYKQELLFDVTDYRQVVSYARGRSDYFANLSDQYRANCRNRFGVDPVDAG